jgi:surface protein
MEGRTTASVPDTSKKKQPHGYEIFVVVGPVAHCLSLRCGFCHCLSKLLLLIIDLVFIQEQHNRKKEPASYTVGTLVMAAIVAKVTAVVVSDGPFETKASALRLPEELVLEVLSHWDVRALVVNKRVCCNWLQLCTQAIDAKQTNKSRRTFQTNEGLCAATKLYVGYYDNPNLVDSDDDYDDLLLMSNTSVPLLLNRFGYCNPEHAEELATCYGWPIRKWDVSNVRQFATVFAFLATFNEDIALWDVSNTTSFRGMFGRASFNQDISKWNTSNVTNMTLMFCDARAFNQDLSLWDTSKVIQMQLVFFNASSFNGVQYADLQG